MFSIAHDHQQGNGRTFQREKYKTPHISWRMSLGFPFIISALIWDKGSNSQTSDATYYVHGDLYVVRQMIEQRLPMHDKKKMYV